MKEQQQNNHPPHEELFYWLLRAGLWPYQIKKLRPHDFHAGRIYLEDKQFLIPKELAASMRRYDWRRMLVRVTNYSYPSLYRMALRWGGPPSAIRAGVEKRE